MREEMDELRAEWDEELADAKADLDKALPAQR